MVIMSSTLLRLLGDSTQSSYEVRNSFREPVLVKANSQVALTGINAQLKPFVVPLDGGQMQVGAGGYVDGSNYEQVGVNITQGSYSAYGFAREAELAFNYPIVNETSIPFLQNQLLGVDNVVNVDKGYSSITTKQTNMANVVLDDWQSTSDPPASITGNSFTASSEGATILLSSNRIPRLSSKISATFTNCSTIYAGMIVYDSADATIPVWGVETRSVDGTPHWHCLLGNEGIDTGVACADGDVISLFQYGGTVTIYKGTNVIYTSPAFAVARSNMDLRFKVLSYQVYASANGTISNIQATELDGLDTLLKNEVPLQAGIQFVSLTGKRQYELADYFGFPKEFEPIKYRGNPAILTGQLPMQAIPNWSGIIVCLEGIGILQSHDGARESRSPSNILYVINELKGINNEYLQLDLPSPIYLNLKNGKDVNLSELRIRMLEASGFNPVQFDGKPSFTLVIREKRGSK